MKEFNSNWEREKQKSSYHFNNFTFDEKYDCVKPLGLFTGDWQDEIESAINTARPATWRDRSYDAKPNPDIDIEEQDMINAGMDPNSIISHLEYSLTPKFQKMCDLIGLEDPISRVHVQMPGQVFIKHIDKLEKWKPDDPSQVLRVQIMLTDWDQGHFLQFGNYTYQGWKAGDVSSFDWYNVPHSSANAGFTPRVSMLTTGVITKKTREILSSNFEIKID